MPKVFYRAKKFKPETQVVIRQAQRILEEYESQGFDLTLRQLYYQFVARGLIKNHDREYKRLGDIVADARMAGLIDWESIVDRTRNLREVNTWESPTEIVSAVAKQFKMPLWDDQPYYVEVWIEKDALVGVIEGVCKDWYVPHFSCRGYMSASEMWLGAQRLRDRIKAGKRTVILHLGDHDPSGIDMTRDIRDRLEHFLSYDIYRDDERAGSDEKATRLEASRDAVAKVGSSFEVRRIALTMEQIERFDPPPNPAKLTDSRSSGYVEEFGYESWELDALDPVTMADLIQTEVEGMIDFDLWEAASEREAKARRVLSRIASRWDEVEEQLGGEE